MHSCRNAATKLKSAARRRSPTICRWQRPSARSWPRFHVKRTSCGTSLFHVKHRCLPRPLLVLFHVKQTTPPGRAPPYGALSGWRTRRVESARRPAPSTSLQRLRSHLNPALHVSTILLTMYDGRTRLAEQVAQEVRTHFGDLVLAPTIPRSVRISEAPGYGQTVLTYDPSSRGARAYVDAARELAERSTQAAVAESANAQSERRTE